jgi:hypothetical protein
MVPGVDAGAHDDPPEARARGWLGVSLRSGALGGGVGGIAVGLIAWALAIVELWGDPHADLAALAALFGGWVWRVVPGAIVGGAVGGVGGALTGLVPVARGSRLVPAVAGAVLAMVAVALALIRLGFWGA